MSEPLPWRVFRRRGLRALRRMTPPQHAVFSAVRFEDLTFPEVAERLGISAGQVQAELSAAFILFCRTIREPEPWWRRWWPW